MSDFRFNQSILKAYSSNTQKVRVASEEWVLKNIFCPNCGNGNLNKHKNNNPVGDFFCSICNADYELKSKLGRFGKKIVDGSFHSMLERINCQTVPNFFFLNYNIDYSVNSVFAIPSVFFTKLIIEERKPLSQNAKRSGWIGCNILFEDLPREGKVVLVDSQKFIEREKIICNWAETKKFTSIGVQSRGWLFEIMYLVQSLKKENFYLGDLYSFEEELQLKFQNNNNVKPKIRQQLQILRNLGYIKFLGQGKYQLIIKE